MVDGLPAPMPEQPTEGAAKKQGAYTMKDAMQVADDILNLSREKQYSIGAFVHGQIFALEFTTAAYGIPAQQIAEIKRDCRKYISEMLQYQSQQAAEAKTEAKTEEKAEAKPTEKAEQKTEKKAEPKAKQKVAQKTE
jgi:hypothetical protein